MLSQSADRRVGTILGLEQWFAVVKTKLSIMLALIRMVCMPWSHGQRMTGSAVMASAVMQEMAVGWNVVSGWQEMAVGWSVVSSWQRLCQRRLSFGMESAEDRFGFEPSTCSFPGRIYSGLAGLLRTSMCSLLLRAVTWLASR